MLGPEDRPDEPEVTTGAAAGGAGETEADGAGAARSVGARLVDEHADALWRFVVSRVRSAQAAEDVVQEVFVAALEGRASFAGGSSERTWLLGIASHKVADYFRRRRRGVHREVGEAGEDGGACGCEVCRALFTEAGMWARRPGEWGAGESESENRGAREALRGCVDALPEAQREAMWMRDVLGVPASEVCKALGVTATNLWTRLHRARSAVRSCLQGKLGGDGDRGGRVGKGRG